MNKFRLSLLRPSKSAGLALVSAAALTTAMATALPAQAATSPAPVRSCGVSLTVHLHGKVFHVHRYGRFGIVRMRGRHMAVNQPINPSRKCKLAGFAGPAASSGLQYGGGPLEINPVVYLDFWGSQWDSDSNGVEQYMQNLFSGLGASGDNWSTTMSQYTDSSGNSPQFTGPVLGGSWVDDSAAAPASATASQLAAEAQYAAQHFGGLSGPNVDIFVVSPSGTTPDGFNAGGGFCAWHDWNGTTAYTNMPYVLDAGSSCGENSVQGPLDGFSIVGGHEYAEAVTDPEPSSGYVDPSGEEIGDLCAWTNLGTVGLSTGTFAMQPLWSNADGGCVM
jgi:hypothetical protein